MAINFSLFGESLTEINFDRPTKSSRQNTDSSTVTVESG